MLVKVKNSAIDCAVLAQFCDHEENTRKEGNQTSIVVSKLLCGKFSNNMADTRKIIRVEEQLEIKIGKQYRERE